MTSDARQPGPGTPGGLHRAGAARLAVAVIVFLAFSPLVTAEFGGLDDELNVAANPHLNPPTWEGLLHHWRGPAFSLYVPLTYTAWFAVATVAYSPQPDAAGVHLNPHLFHLLNILLHVAASVGAFELLRRCALGTGGALLGALLFGLHPVQVEPVAWIAGTKDVLAGALAVAALWQYLAAGQSDVKHRRAARWTLATSAFVLAMLAKPSAVVVPLLAPVLDRFANGRPWRSALVGAAPWFVLSIPCIIWTRLFQDVPAIERTVAVWQRPLIAADALGFYLAKIAWPARLAVDYGRAPVLVIERGWSGWAWLLPIAVGLVAFGLRRRARGLVFGLAVFALALLPVLGLVPFDFQFYSTVADHYLYLPMLGIAIVAGWLARRGSVNISVALAVIVLLGARTILQTRHWRDAFAIFAHAVDVNPRSWAAWNQLGMNYQRIGQDEQAIRAYRAAAAIRENDVVANTNLANLLADRGDLDAAIRHYRAALNNDPPSPLVHANLAGVYEQLGRLDEAAENYRAALELAPGMPQALAGLERVGRRSAPAATPPAPDPL